MTYLLHICYATGAQETRRFPSAFARALVMIVLAEQPVNLRIEDLNGL